MNQEYSYDYSQSATAQELAEQSHLLGAMVRHLQARLEEFDCVKILESSEENALVRAEFQGFSPEQVAKALGDFRQIQIQASGKAVTFYLTPQQRQETIDTIWGGLFHLIVT